MSISGRDLAFLKVHNNLCKSIEDVPEDKKWLLQYLFKLETRIAIFYFLMAPCLSSLANYRFLLYRYFVDFVGHRAYPKYFYVTIDKIEYYCSMMEQANRDLDFDKLADLKRGAVKAKFQSQVSIIFKFIAYDEVVNKYPDQLNTIESKLRSTNSLYNQDDMDTFNWFIAERKIGLLELVCKKGTKLSICEAI